MSVSVTGDFFKQTSSFLLQNISFMGGLQWECIFIKCRIQTVPSHEWCVAFMNPPPPPPYDKTPDAGHTWSDFVFDKNAPTFSYFFKNGFVEFMQ